MTNRVRSRVRVVRRVREVLTAEEAGESKYFRRDEGELVGGVEGVGLWVGEVVDGV